MAVAPHLRHVEECWPGGFARKPDEDKAIVEKLELPSEHISLKDFNVAGHEVAYEGEQAVTFRVNKDGALVAFAGAQANQITVDGHLTVFADQPIPFIAWAPVDEKRRVEGGAVMELFLAGDGAVRIPAADLPRPLHIVAQGPTLGSRGEPIPSEMDGSALTFKMEPRLNHRWLFVVPGAAPGQ